MASNLGGWGFLPIMVYTVIQGGSAPKGYLFQASGQYDRVGISLVEVYERISKPTTLIKLFRVFSGLLITHRFSS